MSEIAKRSNREIEIKIEISDLREVADALRRNGFRLRSKRSFERNQLYDFADERLRKSGCALRLRTFGRDIVLTYKGPKKVVGGLKSREELEVLLSNEAIAGKLLARIGLSPAFRYEKFRSVWTKGSLVAAIDETPIGFFLELEGAPAAIRRAAMQLGLSPALFISESYIEMFLSSHRGNMVFKARR